MAYRLAPQADLEDIAFYIFLESGSGAVSSYDGSWDLLARLDQSPLGRRR